MWDCGRWFVVVCPGLVAVVWLQRCARPTASVARGDVVTAWPWLVCPGLVAVGVDPIGAAALIPASGRRVGGDKRARLLPRCGIVAAVSGCDVVAAALYLPAVAVVMW